MEHLMRRWFSVGRIWIRILKQWRFFATSHVVSTSSRVRHSSIPDDTGCSAKDEEMRGSLREASASP